MTPASPRSSPRPRRETPSSDYGPSIERSILGLMLLNRDTAEQAAEQVRAEDFADPRYRQIFEVMSSLLDAGRQANPPEVASELRRTGRAGEGADDLISKLVTDPGAADVRLFDERVRSLHELRVRERVAQTAAQIQAKSTDQAAPLSSLNDVIADLQTQVESASKGRGRGKLEVLSLDQLLATPPEPVSWLIPGLLPRQGLIVLGGRVKEGKTLLAEQIGLAVAANTEPWVGAEIARPGPVLFVGQEGSRNSFVSRIQKQCGALGISKSEHPFQLITRPKRDRLVIGGDLWIELEALCTSLKPVLVVFDPLTWLSDADENANDEMSRLVMLPLQQFATKHDTLVLVIHHVAKPPSEAKGKAPDPKEYTGSFSDEYRGASAIAGATDGNLLWKHFRKEEVFRLTGQLRDGGDLVAWLRRDNASLTYEITEPPTAAETPTRTEQSRKVGTNDFLLWLAEQTETVSIEKIRRDLEIAWETAKGFAEVGVAGGKVIEEKVGSRRVYRLGPKADIEGIRAMRAKSEGAIAPDLDPYDIDDNNPFA